MSCITYSGPTGRQFFSTSSKLGYPSTSFANGVTNLTHVTANEWVGITFICAAMCVMVRGRLIFKETMEKRWKVKVEQFVKAKKASLPVVGLSTQHPNAGENHNPDGGNPLDLSSGTDNVLGAHLLEDIADESFREEMAIGQGGPAEYTSIWEAAEYSVFLDMLSLFENVLTFYRWLHFPSFWSSQEDTAGAKGVTTPRCWLYRC